MVLGFAVEFLIADAIAVLPIVAAIVDALERDFVERVELIVERERIALTLTSDVILAHLRLFELYFAVFLNILKLGVIRAAGRILVAGACHNAKAVVEEAVTPGGTQIPLRFTANPSVSRTGGEVEHTAVRSVFGDKVDATANGVAVHVAGHHLVHLDGLHHVGRNKVELHIAGVAFSRGQAVAVHRHRGEVGAGAAHLSEARFALVVLHVYAIDALQGITYVRIGELAHLVG